MKIKKSPLPKAEFVKSELFEEHYFWRSYSGVRVYLCKNKYYIYNKEGILKLILT